MKEKPVHLNFNVLMRILCALFVCALLLPRSTHAQEGSDGELDNVIYLPLVQLDRTVAQDELAMATADRAVLVQDAVAAAANGNTFPVEDQRMIGDPSKIGVGGVPGCTQAIHDLYHVIGPDGRKYRTWHALWHPKGVNGIPTIEQIIAGKSDPACYFAHEHGDIPLAIAKPTTGAPLPAFGYAMVRAMGSVEAHPGFKIFTHMQGQVTSWHHPNLGWSAPEVSSIPNDWDTQVLIHQGTPSERSTQNSPGATRITQRFHEIAVWAKNSAGQVTNIHVVADTGQPMGSAGCFSLASFLGGGSIGRRIADGCRAGEAPTMYENWEFNAKIGRALNVALTADVVNPMNFVVNMDRQEFKSGSEEICGIETTANGCSQKLPFGHPGTPALAFMGTQRNLIDAELSWRNRYGNEFICTDARGQSVAQSRCEESAADVILQQVPTINQRSSGGPLDRTGSSTTFRLAFPILPADPNQTSCNGQECTWRMPQGAPLGN